METLSDTRAVLDRFVLDPVVVIEPLGSAGGFSGAELWRVVTHRATFCLRKWPSGHPDRKRLTFIHRTLTHVRAAGLEQVIAPLPSTTGETIVEHRGRFWELSDWAEGNADYHSAPSASRLRASFRLLASFHVKAAGSPALEVTDFGRQGLPAALPAPSIVDRLKRVQWLSSGGFERIRTACQAYPWRELRNRSPDVLNAFARVEQSLTERLAHLRTVAVPIQPCIRDVWHDHVFFRGDEVSGLIDFGAMRMDTVASDLARLSGSFCRNDSKARCSALDAYAEIRPLCAAERRLIDVLDASSVVLSGLNWLEWICVDGRVFSEPARVLDRLDELCSRLPSATESLEKIGKF